MHQVTRLINCPQSASTVSSCEAYRHETKLFRLLFSHLSGHVLSRNWL